MRIYWLPFALLLVVLAVLDVIIYRKLKKSFRWPTSFHKLFAWLQVIPWGLAIAIACIPSRSCSNQMLVVKTWLIWAFFLCIVPKVLFFLVYSFTWIRGMGAKWQAMTRSLAALVALGAAGAMIWGVEFTASSLQVHQVEIASPRVPEAFDGYRVVHISDLHVGTYGTDTSLVASLVDEVNAQRPNLICFTGDLVDRSSSEALPFVKPLSRIKATDGVLSILGNHDEASRYHKWASPQEAAADSIALIALEKQMGWRCLINERTMMRRGNDSLVVLGLANMDSLKFMPKMLTQAMPTWRTDSCFKIVLEHHPNAWGGCLSSKATLDLTLSGHTHGGQAVLRLGKWRWSPATFISKEWGGLYKSPYLPYSWLYTSTGVGEVGVPMRLGVRPEIVVITLRHK